MDISLRGELWDNDSADVLRFWGWRDITAPMDIAGALERAGGEDVTLLVNSPGGDMAVGLEIRSMLRRYAGKTTALFQGLGASAATLAATGSEMDNGGVITNIETKDKIGRGYPCMQPKVSFLDPTETYSVGRYQTACGCADILSHLLEIYFVPEGGSMYMLDRFMEGMIKTVIKYAPVALEQPDSYEARANLMWTSSWAINGMAGALQNCGWTCHPIEHELSAIYDITHGLGLAILTPRWMKYVLDDTTVGRFREYGVNVFGIDPSLPTMDIARRSIELTEDFLFNKLGLQSTLTEIGIDSRNFDIMAGKSCHGEVLRGYKALTPEDVRKILEVCL